MKDNLHDLRMDDFEESMNEPIKDGSEDDFEGLLDLAEKNSAEDFSASYDKAVQDSLKKKAEQEDQDEVPSAQDMYYREAKGIHPLSPEEEKECAIRAKAGDLAAKNRLIEANLMLVGFIAKRYMNGDDRDGDIIQEGNLGLIEAVDRFDPNRGYKFSTYAVWWIRKKIQLYMAEQGHPLAIPEKNYVGIPKIRRIIDHYKKKHNGREPTIEELSKITGKSEETLQDIMRAMIKPLSIYDSTREKKEGITLQEVIPDTESSSPIQLAERMDLYETVQEAMKLLNTKERRVIELRFGMIDGISHTFEDIAREFGVKRQRVQQVEVSARKKMLSSACADSLRDYGKT